MPEFMEKDTSRHGSTSPQQSAGLIQMSRQSVINLGIHALHEIGTDSICRVCIASGGSCCQGCRHLANGIGCQLRNTSCTAWLCGFLRFFLYEIDLLQEWNDFWEQVPGQDFREDFTPEVFFVTKLLHLPDLRKLSEALAGDLLELAQSDMPNRSILILREKMDKQIDQLDECQRNWKKKMKIKRNIKVLSRSFPRFQKEAREYRQRFPVSE
ncbi:hypothetical protein [Paenibacillus sp. GCM10027626]|uniref:hypothetical protein n=1 Tax=Paenibacillus sp. GCM10027626 TaxID=3273411 RepID=UPI00362F4173